MASCFLISALEGESLKELSEWSRRILQELRSLPQLADVNSDEQNRGLMAMLAVERATAARLGITQSMVNSAPSATTVVPELLRFIGTDALAAHNASFDLKFLLAECPDLELVLSVFPGTVYLRSSDFVLSIDWA